MSRAAPIGWRTCAACLTALLGTLVFGVPVPGARAEGLSGRRVPLVCLPLFGPCSPAPGTPPVVAVASPTGVSATTAVLGGRVDPEGLATTYQFVYAASAGTGAQSTTPIRELPATLTPQPVSATATGLLAGAQYTAALVATNADGTRTASTTFRTQTVAKPPLGIAALLVDRSVVDDGAPVTVTARLSGQVGLYTTYFGAPRVTLQSRPRLAALSLPSIAEASATNSGVARFLPVTLERNTRFRVRVGDVLSPWLRVYVDPLVELYSSPDPDRQGIVDLAYTAAGDLPGGYAHGPVAFFYRGAGHAGPFRRIAAAVLRRTGVSLDARAAVPAPPDAYFVACTRTPIIPDMGRPFLNRRCGHRTLP